MRQATTPERDVYSVSRLTSEARAVLEGSFPLLWIEGEISNLATPRSGHLYFSLKDDHAQVRCALFRGKRQLLRQQPANGDQVLVRARISFYEPRGDFQLLVEHLEPAGAGSAQRRFEALKQKLQTEGLFDPARKQDLPSFPRHLGVITSPSGAAIRDVLKVLNRRAPHIHITIFPTQVQGAGAAEELTEALELALTRNDCDILLLTRGGGSNEDLEAFNDERLARIITSASIPIVSAVGHEIDFTIADFVADRRAPTPSAAAELISPDTRALEDAVTGQMARMTRTLHRYLEHNHEQLERLIGRLGRASPTSRLQQQQQRLDSLDTRLQRRMRALITDAQLHLARASRRLQGQRLGSRLANDRQRLQRLPERLQQAWLSGQRRREARLSALARELQAVSPLATMQRGYAVLRAGDEKTVITSVDQVAPGEPLNALLNDGSLHMTVDRVDKDTTPK